MPSWVAPRGQEHLQDLRYLCRNEEECYKFFLIFKLEYGDEVRCEDTEEQKKSIKGKELRKNKLQQHTGHIEDRCILICHKDSRLIIRNVQ